MPTDFAEEPLLCWTERDRGAAGCSETGGRAGLQAAAQRPDLVRGVVVVEPVGCPSNAEHPFFETDLPFLAVYGNFIEERNQTGRLGACRSTAEILSDRGVPASVLVLPEIGIEGNSHLMMQDDDNHVIAEKIAGWITEHVSGSSDIQ